MKQEDMQRVYLEYKAIEEQSKQLENQLENLNEQQKEIEGIKRYLDEIKDVKKGSVSLVPISTGIYIKAEISETDHVLVNVGSNVLVKKSLKETKDIMEEQKTEIFKLRENIVRMLYELNMRARTIQETLSKNV